MCCDNETKQFQAVSNLRSLLPLIRAHIARLITLEQDLDNEIAKAKKRRLSYLHLLKRNGVLVYVEGNLL